MKVQSIKINPKSGTITRYLPRHHQPHLETSLRLHSYTPRGDTFTLSVIMDFRMWLFEMTRSEATALQHELADALKDTGKKH